MNDKQTIHYPQDEMHTLLIPVTRGCPYNRCVFCSMYKAEESSEVPFPEIEMQLKHADLYTEKVFLTGADPLNIGFSKLKELLALIQRYLPYCACVAAYASIRSISLYTKDELSLLHDEGLRLLYIGFESGSNSVLTLMHKGHTVADAISQAQKLNAANLSFDAIIIYGLAGENKGKENAIATAAMLNQFHARRLITMNLTIFQGTKLSQMTRSGDYIPANKNEKLLEIKTLLEELEPETPMIFDTTHPTNILKIKGALPVEQERLVSEVLSRMA